MGAILLASIVLAQLPRMDAQANYLLVFLAWLAAILLYLVAVSPPQPAAWREWPGRLRRIWAEQRVAVLVFAGILLVAFVTRALALSTIPYTLGGDEGSQGLEAMLWTLVTGAVVAIVTLIWKLGAIQLLGRVWAGLKATWQTGGAISPDEEDRRLLRTPLRLAPSAVVAVFAVKFRLLEWW